MVPSLVIPIIALIIYAAAYILYGKEVLEKRVVKADPRNPTPAVKFYDGIDYVPTNKYVLYGHQFASIAGAGPIIGPAIAMLYGWLPVLLWVWFGNLLIGAVHDYLALMASVRHEGKSIAAVSGYVMSKRSKYIGLVYIYLALLLVIAAFLAVAAKTFVLVPSAATIAILYMPIAVLVGFMIYKLRVDVKVATVVGIILIIIAFYVGLNVPIIFDFKTWVYILAIYSFLAAWLPVWYLLQPRDYMNAFILWFGLLLGTVAAIVSLKPIEQPPIIDWAPPIYKVPTPFWPAIPLIVACGALSGFHSLVSSGTTSKQLANELDALLVGYGGMLTEGFLSTIVIMSIAAYWTTLALDKIGGIVRFYLGYGVFVARAFGFDDTIGITFAAVWISCFVLTTLDTSNRLGRFVWVELLEPIKDKVPTVYKIFANRIVASLISVAIGTWLAFGPFKLLWPGFAGMNQLLAALALMTAAAWVYTELKASTKVFLLIAVPALFLWVTVVCGLIWFIYFVVPMYAPPTNYAVGAITLFGLLLAIVLLYDFIIAIRRRR